MKTQLLILSTLLVFSVSVHSQSKACDKFFEKYAGKEGFTTLNIPSSLLNLFLTEKSKSDFKMKYLKVLSLEDKTLSSNLNFYKEIVPGIDRSDYNELLSVREKDEDLIVLYKGEKDNISEFILISGGKDNVLINFVGRIPLADMFKITKSISQNDSLKELEPESLDK